MPEIIFLIPIIGILAGVAHKWMQMKERQFVVLAERSGEQAERSAARDAAKIERLEQRVAVLERILTDRSTLLGDEIERLRDAPVN